MFPERKYDNNLPVCLEILGVSQNAAVDKGVRIFCNC